MTIQRTSPTKIAIGTSNHNQRQPVGGGESAEGVRSGSCAGSSPGTFGVSSIVPAAYQAGWSVEEAKVTSMLASIGNPVLFAGPPVLVAVQRGPNDSCLVVVSSDHQP